MEHGPQTPVISNVTGVKEWHAWYCNSGSLSCSALHTLYTLVDEMDKWEGAKGRIPNQKSSICPKKLTCTCSNYIRMLQSALSRPVASSREGAYVGRRQCHLQNIISHGMAKGDN